jgi:hypothetical protein
MALRIHKEKVAALKSKKIRPEVSPEQNGKIDSTVNKIPSCGSLPCTVVPRQATPELPLQGCVIIPETSSTKSHRDECRRKGLTSHEMETARFNKIMEDSIDIINKNRIIIDNYYVDLRWEINNLKPSENVFDTIMPLQNNLSQEDSSVQPILPIIQTKSVELVDTKEITVSESKLPHIVKQTHYTNVSQKAIYKNALDEKEIRLRKILMYDIPESESLKRKRQSVNDVRISKQENPQLIPNKKKRTESSHIIIF